MKLEHLQMRKLLAHNTGLYHPTLRPMEELEVVYRRVAAVDLWPTPQKWKDWCDAVDVSSRGLKPALGKKTDEEKERLKTWTQRTTAHETKTKKTVKKTIFRRPRNLKLLQRRRWVHEAQASFGTAAEAYFYL